MSDEQQRSETRKNVHRSLTSVDLSINPITPPIQELEQFVGGGSKISVDGVNYNWWREKNGKGNVYGCVINDDPETELLRVKFSDLPTKLQQFLIKKGSEKWIQGIKRDNKIELESIIRGHVPEEEVNNYLQAYRLLKQGHNAFLRHCVDTVKDYHALDDELIKLMLRSALRPSFSSNSALLHVDCTGPSGAGKNDVVNKVLRLIPDSNYIVFTSTSPTAVYYSTLRRKVDKKGAFTIESDPYCYRNKIIAITEVADSAGFTALKALAEIDEKQIQKHCSTVNGTALTMEITGPRCVWTTSVNGVDDDQVKRRFIHVSVSQDTEANKLKKIGLITQNLLDQADIESDERTAVAQAGFSILFGGEAIEFYQIDPKAARLIQTLNRKFILSGYSTTSINQFFSLCECAAVEKRFYRSYCRIEIADVCEAWFLLSNFEKETVSKLSQNGVLVLEAIKTLTGKYDAEFEEEIDSGRSNKGYGDLPIRPIRKEIADESGVPPATVYRMLDTKNTERMGILIELGYVNHSFDSSRNTYVYELTEVGRSVLGSGFSEVKVESEIYRPEDPTEAALKPTDQHPELASFSSIPAEGEK